MRLIDADALLAQFPCTCGCMNCGQMKDGILPCDIKDKIKEAPTIDRPHGEQIYKKFDEKTGISNSYFCSHCDFPLTGIYNSYCAVCGAEMSESPSEVCRKKGEQITEWFLQGFQGMKEGEAE